MWATSQLHLPDHLPPQNEKQASVPYFSGPSVHFHLCKYDGQDGVKRKINSPRCPALADAPGGIGEGDKGHVPGGQAPGGSVQKGL